MRSNLRILNNEIERILADYPDYPYQRSLAIPEIRQRLVEQVMDKIQKAYPGFRESDYLGSMSEYLHHSPEFRLHLESYTYWEIEYIIQNNLDLLAITHKNSQPNSFIS